MKVRYSEIFFSFQGEAAFAGTPCIWIRFFGCNLECNGFGQKDPTDESSYVLPYKEVNIDNVKRVEDLPVFSYGCDSSYSWSNRYKHLVHDNSPEEVAELLEAQLIKGGVTNKDWIHPVTQQPIMLSFTGGEPMMWQKQMVEIMRVLRERGNNIHLINIETNTTQKIKPLMLRDIQGDSHLHFSMSPKLFAVSGERNVIHFENLLEYAGFADSSCIKFVHNGSKKAWDEVDALFPDLLALTSAGTEFWIMPVGATKEQQEAPEIADIAMEAMRRGFKVATRNHAYVFGNKIGT